MPITLGILTAAAVVIVLVEVVPKIVEDFEKEKERLQRERLRVAIPMRSVGEGERGVTTGTAGQQDVASEVRKRRSRVGAGEEEVRSAFFTVLGACY